MAKFIAETEKSNKESEPIAYHSSSGISTSTMVTMGLVALTAWLFSDERKLKKMEMEKKEAWHKSYIDYLNQPIITGEDVLMQNLRAQNLKAILETNLTNAKTEEARGRALLTYKIANFVDPNQLSPGQQTFIMRNIFNPDSAEARDPETQAKLDELLIQATKANADSATNETEFKKWKQFREKNKDEL